MPVSGLRDRINSATLDKRISSQEVTELIAAAKAEPRYTPELEAALQQLVDQGEFEAAARAQLERFVEATPARVDLADPTVMAEHATSVAWTPVGPGGALYVDDVSYDDVVQGSISNCYLVAAFAAVAHGNPDAIKDAITENPDGTVSVRFFERRGLGYEPVTVTVDTDLPTLDGTRSKYAKARDLNEHWVTLLEKAYAQWKGNYDAIGNGGNSGAVFEALTGRPPQWTSTAFMMPDELFERLARATGSGKPVTAGTHGKDAGVDYTGTGVYAWHAYTVLGTSERAGQKYVELRNPWGRSEPGRDGKDDGVFQLNLDDFTRLYSSVNIGG